MVDIFAPQFSSDGRIMFCDCRPSRVIASSPTVHSTVEADLPPSTRASHEENQSLAWSRKERCGRNSISGNAGTDT